MWVEIENSKIENRYTHNMQNIITSFEPAPTSLNLRCLRLTFNNSYMTIIFHFRTTLFTINYLFEA